MSRYNATKAIVPGHGPAPDSFLDELISVINSLPDPVFLPNANADIYTILRPPLGPWTSTTHRRAAMCEALRLDGGYESEWNWNEGADATAGRESPSEEETGLWQVSANSMAFSPTLAECVDRVAGAHDTQTFIRQMKANHALAVEYTARLFRFSTRWSGPCNRGWIGAHVSRAAVAEFETFLQ